MQTYTVSPAHASHPAAREIVASTPGQAAGRAAQFGMPCSADYTYRVYSEDGGHWEIETDDSELETVLSGGGIDAPYPAQPALAL